MERCKQSSDKYQDTMSCDKRTKTINAKKIISRQNITLEYVDQNKAEGNSYLCIRRGKC